MMTSKDLQECRDALADSDKQGGEYMHPSWVEGLLEEVGRLQALVETAFREGRDEDSPDHPDVDAAWQLSDARKALEGA